jgi:signal recognition particle subunit SRP19
MPSKKEGYIVLYPEYFDRSVTRREGRKVPRALAVSNPDLKILANAARKLGFKHQVDDKHHFSSRWFDRRGRILITSRAPIKGDGKKLTKTKIITMIGQRLRMREENVEKQ